MLDKSYIFPSDALKKILSLIPNGFSSERLKLHECYGRVTSSDIISPEHLPAFSRSTVDGYAVNSLDTFGAKELSPVYLTIKNEILMGQEANFTLMRGEAAIIPTGGMLPPGADAVVMLEDVQLVDKHTIEVLKSVAPNENVVQKGEDIKKGDKILPKGHKLRYQDIGALAGVGIKEVDVYRKVYVSIISTGDEIVPFDSPIKIGQIRDINSFTLTGLIKETGSVPINKGIFRDSYHEIKTAILNSLEDSDVILVSGGTSAGNKDMIADIINDISKPGVLFHGVAMKPGKPLIGGIINNKPIFGLPGHPAATIVCFNRFVRPVIEKLMGIVSEKNFLKKITARLTKSIASSAGREDHIRVYLEKRNNELFATPILGKSGLISTLVKADGVLIIPCDVLGINEGEKVEVIID